MQLLCCFFVFSSNSRCSSETLFSHLKIRQRSHCTGEIWRRSFISVFSFLSTLIRHENGNFQKRSSNRRNLKTPALCFNVDTRHFENRAFRKRDDIAIIIWFLSPSFPQTQMYFEFQIKIQKISRRCSRSPNYAELGHFTLLFCRGRLRNLQTFITHVQSHCSAH